MQTAHSSAPPPDLRIVQIESVQPHEEHDNQRSDPLVERLRHETMMINPPLVAPISPSRYVILDGANRCFSFARLDYPHILVQVASYESGYVELGTWRHIISDWDVDAFLGELRQLEDIELREGQARRAIAHLMLPDKRVFSLHAPVQNTRVRNAALRHVVHVYQRKARLYRTAIPEPRDIWPLYPEAIGLMVFPHYNPSDIIAAAKYEAYLPAGISRHVIHGRALRVNYPLDALRDSETPLMEKNQTLKTWMQEKLAKRKVRYYAEATYQFDE